MAKQNRLYLTLSEENYEKLVRWAKADSRNVTNLGLMIIEKAIDEATKEGIIPPSNEKLPNGISVEGVRKAGECLQAMARGEKQAKTKLAIAAHALGMPTEDLMKMQEKLMEVKEGSPHDQSI